MRRFPHLLLALALVGGVAGAAPYPRPGRTERVSISSGGAEPDVAPAFQPPRLSADGRFVAFSSSATNLVPGDDNGFIDVFLRDREEGTTERLSVAPGGAETDGGSSSLSVSADGRMAAFSSAATNLIPGDTNGKSDVFVLDRESGEIRMVTTGSNGTSSVPIISADGRHVAFNSLATNLAPGDTNGVADTFVHDLDTGITTLASVTTSGAAAGIYIGLAGSNPAISGDGRFVAFNSSSAALVAGDANANADTFVRDMETGTTELISVSSEERQTREAVSSPPSISADGRYVTFDTWSWQLVPLDTNGDVGPVFITFALGFDVYVRDRLAGTTTEVSLSSAGIESARDSGYAQLSPDGRYVTYTSPSANLVPGDTAAQTDIFVHDLVTATTERVSLSSGGEQGNGGSFLSTTSAGGRVVAFQSTASNLADGDANGVMDLFVRERGGDLGVVGATAVRNGEGIAVSGGATFSGAVVASNDDPVGDASLAVPGSDLTRARLIYRPELEDLLLRLDITDLPEIRDPRVQAGTAGTMGAVYGVEMTVGTARFVARGSQRGAAISPRVRDEEGSSHTPSSEETWDFELISCTQTCAAGIPLRPLEGGYGTSGDEVRIAIPLEALGLAPGSTVSQVSAFTAPGDAAVAPVPYDSRDLPSFTIPRATVRILGEGIDAELPVVGGRFGATIPVAGDHVEVRACLATCGAQTRLDIS